MRAVVLMGLVLVVGCDKAKDTGKAEVPMSASPKIIVKDKAAPKKEPPKVDAQPEPVKPKTFEEAWAEALEAAKKLNTTEPEETRKAMQALNEIERSKAQSAMMGPFVVAVNPLRQLGLIAWVEKQSRTFAFEDQRFKKMAEAVWKANTNTILGMANSWVHQTYKLRSFAADAIIDGTPATMLLPNLRDEVLILAGPEWFSR